MRIRRTTEVTLIVGVRRPCRGRRPERRGRHVTIRHPAGRPPRLLRVPADAQLVLAWHGPELTGGATQADNPSGRQDTGPITWGTQ